MRRHLDWRIGFIPLGCNWASDTLTDTVYGVSDAHYAACFHIAQVVTFLAFVSDLENISEQPNNKFKIKKNCTPFTAPSYDMNV